MSGSEIGVGFKPSELDTQSLSDMVLSCEKSTVSDNVSDAQAT
jgi:hypothetical protein